MTKSPLNVASHLARMAVQHPAQVAIHAPIGRVNADGPTEHRAITFLELNADSDAIAHGLASIGIARGTRTALMVPPTPDFFALTFALFKVGAVPVLIDPGMGVKNLGKCLAEAEPEVFIGIAKAHVARRVLGWARKSLRTTVNVGQWRFYCHTSLERLREMGRTRGAYHIPESEATEPAAILFTSGSTGVAKGVVYTHGIFASQVELLKATYGIEPGEIDLCTFPLFALFGPALGMTCVIPDMNASRPAQIDPHKAVAQIKQFGVTNMFGSPAVIRRLGEMAGAEPNPLTPFPKKEGGTEPNATGAKQSAAALSPSPFRGGVGEGLQPQPTPPSPLAPHEGEPPAGSPYNPLLPGKGEKELSANVASNTAASHTSSPFPSGRGAGGVGSPGGRLSSLRRVISAGAPASAASLERFVKLLPDGAEVFTPYGATEALPVANIGSREILVETRYLTEQGRGVCVGRPVAGMEVYVISISDEPIAEWSDSLLAAPGEVGEFVVRGPVVTRQYYNRPDATKLAKIRDPKTGDVLHRMGDVGYLDAQGRLWFCGRKSHRVVTPGGTLFTDMVEPIFNTSLLVERSALVGVARNGITHPVLCVEWTNLAFLKCGWEHTQNVLRERAQEFEHTRAVRTFLLSGHPGTFPVDVRHNSKIFREKLAVWADKTLGPKWTPEAQA